jgi:Tfp pilus assembly protein PilV
MNASPKTRGLMIDPCSPSSGHVRRDETGVSLILALVMLVVLSFIFLALASSSITTISNSTNLRSQRSTEYAASGATLMAVRNVRSSGLASSTLQACLPNVKTLTINGVTIEVDCQLYASNPGQTDTRVINFYACAPGGAPSPACSAGNALLSATVAFNDLNGVGQSSCPGTTCGTSEDVKSWVVQSGNNPVTP